MKTCNKCRQPKRSEAFGKMSASRDGLQRTCRQCQSEYQKQPERLQAERIRARRRYETIKEEPDALTELRQHQLRRYHKKYSSDEDYKKRKREIGRKAAARYYRKKKAS